MGQLRVEKVQELIKQETSKMILNELKDPRIGFVTVTNVEASPDLRHAKIFLSILGSAEQQKQTWEALLHALGYIRSEIGKRVRMRFTPEISLHLDKSLEYSVHIQELLGRIQQEDKDS